MDFLVRSLNWVGSQMWSMARTFRGWANSIPDFLWWFSDPLNWLADAAETAAYGLWDAAEGAYDAWVWIQDRARELWDGLNYLYGQASQNIQYLFDWVGELARQSWDWLTNQVNWLLSQVSQLWDRFWGWAEPLLNETWEQLQNLGSWMRDTVWPWIQAETRNIWDWFTQKIVETSQTIEVVKQDIVEQFQKIDPLESLIEIKDRITSTFIDNWDKLSAFLADPPGTIWAWLEAGLWPRIEAWLITVWDGTDRKT